MKINEGKVLFGWRDDRPLDMKGIQTAVDRAGFTLKGVHVTVVGKIARQDDRYVLLLPESLKQRFTLYEPNAVKDPNDPDRHGREGLAALFTKARRQRLDEAVEKGLPVQIIGPVHLHKAEHKEKPVPPALGIDELTVLEPAQRASQKAR